MQFIVFETEGETMSLELQVWRTLAWPQINSPIEPQQGLFVCL